MSENDNLQAGEPVTTTTAIGSDLPLLLTAKEVATLFRCGLDTVYRLVSQGKLTTADFRPVRIHRESVLKLLNLDGDKNAPAEEPGLEEQREQTQSPMPASRKGGPKGKRQRWLDWPS